MMTFTHALAINDAYVSRYWYYVLYLNDQSQPPGHARGVWFTQQAFQSRSTGLETVYCTQCSSNATCAPAGGRCNLATKHCEYPCDIGWCEGVPDETCYQYRLMHPTEALAWVDTFGVTSYAQVPLLPTTPYLSLCGDGMYTEGGSNGKHAANWTGPGTHTFCFEVSRTQLSSVLSLVNQAALVQDRGAPCSIDDEGTTCGDDGRTCVAGECRVFGQLSTNASDYELEFTLINAEAVGPGVDANGEMNIARIGLSVQEYTLEILSGV